MKFVYLPYDEAPKFEDFSGLCWIEDIILLKDY